MAKQFNQDSLKAWTARLGEWAVITFGPAKAEALRRRIVQELDELQEELLGEPGTGVVLAHRIEKEMGDVLVTMLVYAHHTGIDMGAVLEKVQSLNESRKWKRHGDGTGQHVKE